MGDLSLDLWVSLCEKIVVALTIPELRAKRQETECQDPGSPQGSRPDLQPEGALSQRSAAAASCGLLFLTPNMQNGDTLSIQMATTKEGVRDRKGHSWRAPLKQLAHRQE